MYEIKYDSRPLLLNYWVYRNGVLLWCTITKSGALRYIARDRQRVARREAEIDEYMRRGPLPVIHREN